MNLAELADEALQRLGERKTLVFDGVLHTNAEFHDRGRRFHRALEELGLGKGDVIGLCMVNHPAIYPVFQGIFRRGATAAPVMFQLTATELRYVLADTEARAVVTDIDMLPKVREAIQGLDHVQWVLVRGGSDEHGDGPAVLDLESLLDRDPQATLPAIADDDVALMLYTSGTTGRPKGVMLTHANLIASAEAANDAGEPHLWEGPRIMVSAMPMAHIFGVGVMNGGYLAAADSEGYGVQMRWFEAEGFMRLIQEHRATSIPAVPTMLSLILNHPAVDDYDLSSLVEVACGAAPLPVELARRFSERYGCRIREIYGMTENAGIGSANRRSEEYRPGSAGRAYCNTEVRTVDDEDNPLPAGERGEIVTRGPTTMKGYHNRPEETAEALRGGWMHSGDIGYLDEDGFLFIVDRKKDMILRGGENIYPAEIEDILYRHPDVAEAAVVGVPDDTYGENVIAYVARRDGCDIREAEIISFVKEHTSAFKAPSRVFFVDELPKSGVGKILRRELRDRALTDTADRA